MSDARSGLPRRTTIGLAVASVFIPSVSSANAGTPLMWATMAHLLVGNALLGLIEGALVARFLPARRQRAVPWMIAGNYVSAWVGLLLLDDLARGLSLSIENVGAALAFLVAASWVFTVVLEWPFVVGSAGWRTVTMRRTFLVCTAVQAATYVPLFAWYYGASGVSLVADTKRATSTEIRGSAEDDVYFIGADDGDVWKVGRGTSPVRVCPLGSREADDRLYFEKVGDDGWTLTVARGERAAYARILIDLPALHGRGATLRRSDRDEEPGTWSNFGPAMDLRPTATRSPRFWTGFWPIEGIWAEGGRSGEGKRLSLETPIAAWAIRNATVLPGNEIVFQLGRDQVCELDWASARLALIGRGRGPAVLLR